MISLESLILDLGTEVATEIVVVNLIAEVLFSQKL
jgi:hypothetical protein